MIDDSISPLMVGDNVNSTSVASHATFMPILNNNSSGVAETLHAMFSVLEIPKEEDHAYRTLSSR